MQRFSLARRLQLSSWWRYTCGCVACCNEKWPNLLLAAEIPCECACVPNKPLASAVAMPWCTQLCTQERLRVLFPPRPPLQQPLNAEVESGNKSQPVPAQRNAGLHRLKSGRFVRVAHLQNDIVPQKIVMIVISYRILVQNLSDRDRSHQIKFSESWDSDSSKFSEFCVLLFLLEKYHKNLAKLWFSKLVSVTLQAH